MLKSLFCINQVTCCNAFVAETDLFLLESICSVFYLLSFHLWLKKWMHAFIVLVSDIVMYYIFINGCEPTLSHE